jgi:hypothetical protein
MRKLALLLTIIALPLAFTATATATPPQRGTFNFPAEGVDPAGTTCAFPVAFTQVSYGFFTVFFDADGNVVKVIVHENYDATISANGITLVERDTFTTTFYPDGARIAGLWEHVQGPGGLVIRDAGQIVFNPDGTVNYVRGPHPFLFGESFCPALTP